MAIDFKCYLGCLMVGKGRLSCVYCGNTCTVVMSKLKRCKPCSNDGDNLRKNYGFDWQTVKNLVKILRLLLRKQSIILLMLFLVLLALLEQFIVYYVGLIPSGYFKVLADVNNKGFWEQTFESLLLIFAVCFVLSSKQYLVNTLYVSSREFLTNNLHVTYFDRNKFFILNTMDYSRIDNPDQRITQDVEKFCKQLSSLVSPLVVSPFTIIYYTYICYSSTGWIGPVGIFGIFLSSAVINKCLIKQIVSKVVLQERCEGFFRFKHMQVRSYAESMAFVDAGCIELSHTSYHLNRLIITQQSLFLRQFPLDFAVNLFNYVGSIISYLILAIAIFAGKYTNLSPSDLGALISKNAFVSIYLISCFSQIVDLSTSFSQIGGLTYRVSELLDSLEENHLNESKCSNSQSSLVTSYDICTENPIFELKNVSFSTPCGTVPLIKDLSLKIICGSNLLITGNSSSGKTSLLRVIKGLWPISSGTIKRRVPFKPSIVFFLPQKPILTDGTLLDQIVYPLKTSKHEPANKSDETLIQRYLEYVDMLKIVEKAGLNTEVDWNWYDVLSPGEVQRLSFVRLFYHKPSVAFLDEATSAIGQEMEQKLYTMCRDLNITVISLGHRSTLMQYHDINLQLDGYGGWSLMPIERKRDDLVLIN